MTIKIIIECDARGCYKEVETEGLHSWNLESCGFHADLRDEEIHYCAECWPEVQKEVEEG